MKNSTNDLLERVAFNLTRTGDLEQAEFDLEIIAHRLDAPGISPQTATRQENKMKGLYAILYQKRAAQEQNAGNYTMAKRYFEQATSYAIAAGKDLTEINNAHGIAIKLANQGPLEDEYASISV